MNTRKKDATKRTLLWSEDGQIGCTEKGHAPHPGTDSWRKGRWREITLAELVQFAVEAGNWAECESCKAEKRSKKS